MESKQLYRNILRLHRSLPPALRSLGDEYVKSEFQKHKTAERQYLIQFNQEWNNYLVEMKKQLEWQKKAVESGQDWMSNVGKKLDQVELNKFSDEQIGQLYALKEETKKIGQSS